MKRTGKILRAAFLAALLLVGVDAGVRYAGSGEARAQTYQKHAQAPRQVRRERRKHKQRMRAVRMAQWREQMRERRRANPALFDRGRRGERVLRARIVAINPTPEALARARANRFRPVRAMQLGDTGIVLVLLRAPPGMSTQAALDALQALDPQGVYDFDHVYDPSIGQESARGAVARTQTTDGAGVRIGMIDAGVALDHPALAGARIHARSFVDGARSAPSAHGVAVASLLVGDDGEFQGAIPGAQLYAADVFGDSAEGGSAVAIANALAWLSSEGVHTVNISLTGPSNRALEAVCRAMIARGLILVAAGGNDGPTYPVAFPAAVPGVIAVTAVDAENRIYLSANRGPQIAFSAYGVEVEAAVDDGAYELVSGTSFAAPIVTAALARRIRSPTTPEQAIAALSPGAVDLGAPGRDNVYGYGLVR